MRGWRRKRGQEGEQIATEFLQRQGYRIAERNYRVRQGEVDIIAWDGATLVFVEVKTKSNAGFGHPEEMVDARKQRILAQVAMIYVQQKQVEHTALRFDVIAVRLGTAAIPDVSHYLAAFSPSSPYFY
jgi:putative endonuclease